MLKQLNNDELIKIDGGWDPVEAFGKWCGHAFRNYINEERSPEEQARIREMNRQHYGY